MRRKESHVSKTCRSRGLSSAAAASGGASAPNAGIRPIGTRSSPGGCMTGRFGPQPPEGPGGHLFPALLFPLPQVLQRGSLGPGRSQQPLHSSGRCLGGATGGRGRPAVSVGLLALVARSPCLRPVCHHPELGGSGGG